MNINPNEAKNCQIGWKIGKNWSHNDLPTPYIPYLVLTDNDC